MGTTRSLHSFRTIQLTACNKPTKTQKSKWIKLNKETIFHIFCILGAMMSFCRFYLTYLRVFQGIPGFHTCWRLYSYITKFKLNMSGWVTSLSKDIILYYSKYEVYITQNIKTIKYSLLNYRKRDSDEWKAGNAVKKARFWVCYLRRLETVSKIMLSPGHSKS